MLTEMPWQFLVLIVEFWASALIAAKYIFDGRTRRYGFRTLPWAACDVAMIALLVWGATHASWQYVVVAFMYILAVTMNLYKSAQGKAVDFKKPQPGSEGMTTFFLAIIPTIQTLLLVTG